VTRTPIIQGDVMLIPVDIPAAAVLQSGRRHVLAEGEATGHAHVVEHVDLYQYAGVPYVLVQAADIVDGAVLTHEDHGPIPLTQLGGYEVRRKVEIDLLSGLMRWVAD